MSSRDIWSQLGNLQIRDVLASLLSARLLADEADEPLYVCSPFLTDFPLFDNGLGQFQALFTKRPKFGEQSEIRFSQVLIEVSERVPVRLIGVPGPNADAFLRSTITSSNLKISGRHASDLHHEKGLLCRAFYLEGSMNFTYSGVYKNGEKISVYTPDSDEGRKKIGSALLQFDRLWNTLQHRQIPRTQ